MSLKHAAALTLALTLPVLADPVQGVRAADRQSRRGLRRRRRRFEAVLPEGRRQVDRRQPDLHADHDRIRRRGEHYITIRHETLDANGAVTQVTELQKIE